MSHTTTCDECDKTRSGGGWVEYRRHSRGLSHFCNDNCLLLYLARTRHVRVVWACHACDETFAAPAANLDHWRAKHEEAAMRGERL